MRRFYLLPVLASGLLFYLAAPGALCAVARAAGLALESGSSVYPVRNVQLIVDPQKTLSIYDLRRLETLGKAPWRRAEKLNFGYSQARYWLKVEIVNVSAAEQDWVLEFGYPMIQVLHVHRFDDAAEAASWSTGRLVPFGSRPICLPQFSVQLFVPEKFIIFRRKISVYLSGTSV